MRFNLTRPYFGRHRFEASAQRSGLTMTFTGWTYPSRITLKLSKPPASLIDLLREPRPGVQPGAV